ncbi:hypothetical protein K435DRAFT_804682 [Dendrothele bispora CBS 962.96]|uniref:Uncharacterized protein n=1 Tax=Dendrothele bispora (strain CBS 962.96) TaxID=1314807 RepID=A0A4S8LE07_DENBC|nr:hypothetical protein K435DRAFT_806443 [Dendrothele bispora CBS 962.96]THU87001.1 hypothetical protein K435DRAFT_804682 [Dendrothele bispora CBS 962.96]
MTLVSSGGSFFQSAVVYATLYNMMKRFYRSGISFSLESRSLSKKPTRVSTWAVELFLHLPGTAGRMAVAERIILVWEQPSPTCIGDTNSHFLGSSEPSYVVLVTPHGRALEGSLAEF